MLDYDYPSRKRTPIERAKSILDVCAYELKAVSTGNLMTLEAAIAAEIEDALRDQLHELNQGGRKTPENVIPTQLKILKVRKGVKKK